MALEIGAWFRKLLGKVEEPKKEEGKRVGGEMTAKEAGEAMQAGLSGIGAEYTDGFNRSNKNEKPQEQKEKSFWDRPIGKVLTVVGSAAVGAGAGALLIGGLSGAIVGGAVVGLLGLASCTKEKVEDPKPSDITDLPIDDDGNATIEDTTIVNQTVNIDLGSLLASMNAILAAINQGNQNLQAIYDKLKEISQQVNQLSTQLSESQINLLNAINSLINKIDVNHDDTMNALNAILAKLQTMDDNNAANFTAILNAMANMDVTMQHNFGMLLEQLMQMDENQQAGVAAILAAITHLEATEQQNAANIMQQLMDNNALLQQILNKINGLSEQQQQYFQQIIVQLMGMGGDLQALLDALNANNDLLNEILGKMDQLNATIQHAVEQLLAKLDQIDTNNQEGFLNVINHLSELNATMQAGVVAILNKLDQMDASQQQLLLQILGNLDNISTNQLEQIQQLANILAAIHAGNVQIGNIATLIQNLDLGTGVNLDVIESLLQQILAQEQANGNVLNNIQNNQTLIINTVNSIHAQITQIQQQFNEFANENLNYLQQILDRIPTDIAGCNCDCERIIELLEIIVDCLQNPDWNHEGLIEDDWGDILG